MRTIFMIALTLSFTLAASQHAKADDALPRVEVRQSESAAWAAARIDLNEAGEWKYYGISPEEARRWKDAGIEFPGWANQWKTEGFAPEEAAAWKKINVYTARDFKANGFNPDEAVIWINAGIRSGLRAGEFTRLGFNAHSAAEWWKLRFFPLDAKELRDAGFTPEEALAWKYKKTGKYSSQVYSTSAIKAWKDAGYSLPQMREWTEGGFKIEEAAAWTKAGFGAMEALKWRSVGLSAEGASAELSQGHTPEGLMLDKLGSSGASSIEEFRGSAKLNADTTAALQETFIIEKTAHDELKSGFQLEFPSEVELLDTYGNTRRVRTTYDFEYASVNGTEVKYSIKSIKGRKIVTIGSSEDFLKTGRYSIVVNYKTDNRALLTGDRDSFYVEFSQLPEAYSIKRATAAVYLPQNTTAVSASGLIGKYPFVETDIKRPNAVNFASTMPAAAKERFSVGVSLTKGAISPSVWKRLDYLDREFKYMLRSLAIGLMALLIVAVYYIMIWLKTGIDPKPGHITPEFTPPDNISPAIAGFIGRRGKFDDAILSASILSLAVKGAIAIKRTGSGFMLIKKRDVQRGAIATEEEALLNGLFGDGTGEAVAIGSAEFKNGAKALKSALTDFHKRYFRLNAGYLAPGLALSAAALAVMFALFDMRPSASLILTPFGAALCAYLFTKALAGWAAFGRSPKSGGIIKPVFLTLASAGAATLTRYFIMKAVSASSMWDEQYVAGFGALIIAYAALSIFMHAAFRALFETPTKACGKLMDRIAGFILFLETTETGRFSAISAADGIKSKRDEFITYVVALNIDAQFQASPIKGCPWAQGEGAFSPNDLLSEVRSKGPK